MPAMIVINFPLCSVIMPMVYRLRLQDPGASKYPKSPVFRTFWHLKDVLSIIMDQARPIMSVHLILMGVQAGIWLIKSKQSVSGTIFDRE